MSWGPIGAPVPTLNTRALAHQRCQMLLLQDVWKALRGSMWSTEKKRRVSNWSFGLQAMRSNYWLFTSPSCRRFYYKQESAVSCLQSGMCRPVVGLRIIMWIVNLTEFTNHAPWFVNWEYRFTHDSLSGDKDVLGVSPTSWVTWFSWNTARSVLFRFLHSISVLFWVDFRTTTGEVRSDHN